MSRVKPTDKHVVRTIAIEDTSVDIFFDLFDDLDHDQCDVHVTLFVVLVSSLDEFSHSHLDFIVWRKGLILAVT